MSMPPCHACGADLIVDAYCKTRHVNGDRSHPVTIRVEMPPRRTPVATVHDEGGALVLAVQGPYDDAPRFALSTPTHRGAAYQEARDRGMGEARASIAACIAEYRRLYPDLIVQDTR